MVYYKYHLYDVADSKGEVWELKLPPVPELHTITYVQMVISDEQKK